jgi:acyl-CoA thioesterase
MPEHSKASRIIDAMMAKDRFSQWLGIQRLEEKEGFCKLRMTVREEMCNGFGIAHGGISFSLADSALAFASNSRGLHAVSIETSISHVKQLKAGDVITATAMEQSLSSRIGNYYIEVQRESGEIVALFRGTVFRTEKEWEY